MPAAVRITVITHALVRIEYAPDGRFVDVPSLFAIHGPTGNVPIDDPVLAVHTTPAAAGSAPIAIKTDRIELNYTPDGRPPHAGNMRALIRHEAPPPGVPTERGRVVWTPGARNVRNLGGTLSTLDGLRGPVPLSEGLLSRDGWHVVDDSATAVLVDGWAATRDSVGAAGNVDWYLFAYGTDYLAALKTLAIIAGPVPLPRKYALGSWFSRYWPYTSAEFRGIALEYASHGFPLDVMVLDMDWHREGWTGWSWNRELLPDAEELVEWLHAEGLAVTLNLHPADGVGPHEDRYGAFMRALGREPDGSVVPFDAGDRRYMDALFEQVHRPLERPAGRPNAGVDFWWVDWQQDRHVRSVPGLTNLRWLNHLYTQHTRREPGTLGPADAGLRPLSFSRWAGAIGDNDTPFGDHRHPVHFSGDAHTGWAMLAFQVPFTVTAGNVGCFFWSHDIGGHFGPRFEEATTRWVQFGALSPVLRLHSARTATLDRRPWTYEPRFCDAMRDAFQLRSLLMPAIYGAARECEGMLPLLRPMYLSRPTVERAYCTPHQYTIGEHLLCAPVTSPGLGEACVASQYVWFPADGECDAWHDVITGSRFGGASTSGAEAIVSCPIDRTPVYLRAGVPLATQKPTLRMSSAAVSELRVRLFPGRPGQTARTELYEDDGVSLAYQAGAAARTPILAEWSEDAPGGVLSCKLTIGPTSGSFEGQVAKRLVRVVVGSVAEGLSAQADGKDARFIVHPAPPGPHGPQLHPPTVGGVMFIDVGERPIRAATLVEFRIRPDAPGDLALRERAKDLAAALGEPVRPATLRGTVVRHVAGPARSADPRRVEAILRIGAGIGAFSEDHTLRVLDTLGFLDDGRLPAEIIDRVSARETVLSRHDLRVAPDAPADLSLPRADLAGPPLGLRATRLVRFHGSIDGQPVAFEHIITTKLLALTAFRCAGPFDWDWRWSIAERVHRPESFPIDPAGMYVGQGGQRVGWAPAKEEGKWAVNFRAVWPGRGGLAYAAIRIVSPIEQTADIHFDSSDKLEAFVNGDKVFSLDAFDSHAAAAGKVSVTLPQGESLLLVKASDGGGGWGFTASIDARQPLEQRPL